MLFISALRAASNSAYNAALFIPSTATSGFFLIATPFAWILTKRHQIMANSSH
jgi:hypothetical protein